MSRMDIVRMRREEKQPVHDCGRMKRRRLRREDKEDIVSNLKTTGRHGGQDRLRN